MWLESALYLIYPLVQNCVSLKCAERLPKWSVLRRSESNHMPRYSSSSSPPELLNRAPFRSMADGDLNANTTSSRDSPQTPPISVFNRRRSWFTSHAAPGITRPTVLKRGPTLSFDPVATRINDFHPLKRSLLLSLWATSTQTHAIVHLILLSTLMLMVFFGWSF